MKKILFALLILCCWFGAGAQAYNNEWIDYSKTYHKFKVGRTGLHRISKAELDTAGLGEVPAENLQLWRNGVEVPIFTSAPSGVLPEGGFIEFWGERNDGRPDKALYRRPHFQLNDRISLITDTAAYFLTINSAGANRRLNAQTNNLAGNTLAPLPYFMHTHVQSFNNQLNNGYAVDVDQYLYSAAYDLGEGYTSANIGTNVTNTTNLGNLFAATAGPAAKFKITVAGQRMGQRWYRVRINSDSITGNRVDHFNYSTDSAEVPVQRIAGTANSVQVYNSYDRIVIHRFELTYPRLFNFGNATNFEFTLPESTEPRYLEISNFAAGGVQPLLLDLTNGQRYLADITVAGKVRILLQPSAQPARLVLCSQAPANVTAINTLTERRFIDFAQPENQGDYLIISNQLLFNDGQGGNAVEEYRQYRSSAAGGSYGARIYEVDELTDQFGFGIKKTPLAVRNFIMYALQHFREKPRHVFLLGKGIVYSARGTKESTPAMDALNLVPTFGNPASDILLAAAPGTAVPLVSIGRISAVSSQEIREYLDKVKQYESAQATASADPADKWWQKNIAHIIGSGDPNLQQRLEVHMSQCKDIISDTLWGANVHTFTKRSGNNVEQISDKALEQLFEDGISLITYFGHSSSSGLDFNLDNPDAYNNTGKYPLFVALGCQAGGIFGFNANRYSIRDAISEKYVLAHQKGTIGFIANSHFGIVSTLRVWNTQFYQNMAVEHYGKTFGELMSATAAETLAETNNGEENYYVRVNIEETILHADPALRLNQEPKPDYVITEPMVKVDPAFVSIAESSFKLKVEVQNLGKAINQKFVLSVKRKYPNGSEKELIRDSVAAPLSSSSFEYTISVDALTDKGSNSLTVTVDAGEQISELFETNNSVTKEVFIYGDEVRPVFPYNFAIVNKQDVKLAFSTANPFSPQRNYQVEMDTTELFNSPVKWSQTINSVGGLMDVKPGVNLQNNTVYYWRVAVVPESGEKRWNTASFVYLEGSEEGFNQSHLYQHSKSVGISMQLDSSTLKWKFGKVVQNIFARNAMYPTGGNTDDDFSVSVNSEAYIRSACVGRSLNFNVFDANSFRPWKNVDEKGNSLFLYGSGSASCRPGRQYNFEFSYMTPAGRKAIMDFMDAIPEGSFVVIRTHDYNNPNSFTSTWAGDTALFGSGNSLYHKLRSIGFMEIDSISKPRAWLLAYQKGNLSKTKYVFTQGVYDKITLSQDFLTPSYVGSLQSPVFGPAKSWKDFQWAGLFDQEKEVASASIIGVRVNGIIETLVENIIPSQRNTDISSIDAKQYPFLYLKLKTLDSSKYTPYQLSHWRLTYDPVSEGAVAPNLFFQMRDSLEIGEPIDFKLAFKNVSTTSFDSLLVKMVITDQHNVTHTIPVMRHKPLMAGDTLHVRYPLDTKLYPGSNMLFVEVNPDNDQPEQFHFNNFIYHPFYVQEDRTAPVVDVTFDNVRILNRDIVSAKPDILIKLTDESNRLLLKDTSLFKIKVRNLANNSLRTYAFGSDTLRLTPASNLDQNEASVNFRPYFAEDGEYELTVSAEDPSGNKAGGTDYRVQFQVINKPMISNMLTYPNPFTTSTAFVFTLTGSEIPQNLKIQILTVTGKVVREITRQELGPLRIGRNITEFKWDGTDQFGQKLANGVYLYRVIAQLNGKSLEKYKAAGDGTDQFFNKGYGKMYLMR